MSRKSRGAPGPSRPSLPSARPKRKRAGLRTLLLALWGTYVAFLIFFLGGGRGRGGFRCRRRVPPPLEEGADRKTVVLVLSRRSGFDRREAIRETWAKDRPDVYFIVGDRDCAVPNRLRAGGRENRWGPKLGCADEQGRLTVADTDGEGRPPLSERERERWERVLAKNEKIAERLDQERARHGDVLVAADVVDTYRSLPAKLKYGYRWATENLPRAEWFVKSDDDAFVHVAELSDYLNTTFREEVAAVDPLLHPAVVGAIRTKNAPQTKGKWKEFPEFRRELYPPFPLGSYGHVVSRPVAQYVADHAARLFEYQGEDVSLGIWLDESPLRNAVSFVDGTGFMNNAQKCAVEHMLVVGHNLNDRGLRMCQRIREIRPGYCLPPPARVVVGPGAPLVKNWSWKNWRWEGQKRPRETPGGSEGPQGGRPMG